MPTWVNLSLGGPDLPGPDLLEQAVETLTTEFGTLFVIAAGNDGGSVPVSSPASAPAAVAVGAVDKADQLADFSNQGPSVDGAPAGEGYVSLRATAIDHAGNAVEQTIIRAYAIG